MTFTGTECLFYVRDRRKWVHFKIVRRNKTKINIRKKWASMNLNNVLHLWSK
jgi:hypothetical protein